MSANLNRVTLTPHQNSFLLEDKNYKNALLINRRRSHRTLLANNDILDVGEMVLLYRNPDLSFDNLNRNLDGSPELPAASAKIKGPVQKGTPILTFLGSQQKIPLIRNLNTMGASNSNDIVIESNEVASRHAKIYKVGETWKIQNLHIHETTSVNGRRIDQRFLQDGDEVTIGDVLIRFNISKTKFRQMPRQKIEAAKRPKQLNSLLKYNGKTGNYLQLLQENLSHQKFSNKRHHFLQVINTEMKNVFFFSADTPSPFFDCDHI